MATTLFTGSNVKVNKAAPPSFFVPGSAGVALPAGLHEIDALINSAGYAAGSTATFAIEALAGGTWQQVASIGGMVLGPTTDRNGNPTTTGGLVIVLSQWPTPTYPTAVRLRVDSIATGTLTSVTLTGA